MQYGDSFTDGKVTKQNILNLVLTRRDWASQQYLNFFQRTKAWYNIYRGITSGAPFGRNDVSVPILFSQIMSDVTNKCQAIFSDDEIIQFIPNNDYEADIARKNSNLVNIQLTESDSYLKAVDFFMSAAVYGTAFARTAWRFERVPKMYRVNVMGQEQILPSVKTKFDGPNWEVVDILDILPEPGKVRLRDCDWIIHTYYMDLDDLLVQQTGEGVPMFSPDAINELLKQPMGYEAKEAWKMRQTTYRTWTDFAARGQSIMAKPVRIDEYWGKVPSEFGINGDRNLVITVANEKVVLRYEPNPFWDDELPFLCYTPMPDMHALHGTGKAEIAAKLQASINKFATIKLDSLEIFANPMFGVNEGSEIAQQGNIVARPGKLIPIRGEDIRSALMPISPDLRALQMTYDEIQQISSFQQQGLGIPNDVVQGLDPVARETARGVLSRKDAAMGRLAGESTIAENQFIIPLAQRYKYYNQQLLTVPKQIKMIGQDAIMDPETGAPLIGRDEEVGYEDLMYDHKCRAYGASRIVSKSMMSQALMAYAQMAAANPIMAQITDWVATCKMIAKSLNLNPTELLIKQVQIPAINQMAAQAGMKPEDMMNQIAQQMDQPMGQAGVQQGMGQLSGAPPANNQPINNMGATSDTLQV